MNARELFEDGLNSLREAPDYDQWQGLPDLSTLNEPDALKRIYDELATLVATKYAANLISFYEGDCLVNNWMCMMVTGADGIQSDLLLDVYEAFDAGEWSGRSEQPIEDFTDPAIAEIVARLGSA